MSGASAPLIDVDALADKLDTVVVADCRWQLDDPAAGVHAYAQRHIPGAIYVSLDDALSDMSNQNAGRHPLPDKQGFATTLGHLGIDNDSTVIAYDDAGGAYASRLWWMLRWVGHSKVALLDGGWRGWLSADRPTATGPVNRAATSFVVGPETMPTVDRAAVGGRDQAAVLVDARAPERFRGDVEPADPAAGHIPGAVNAPFADNLVDGRFLDAAVLRGRFADLGVTGDIETTVYCGSGVTACHDILAMEVAGLAPASLYPGSWSEWSRAGGAVETGSGRE